MDATLWIPVLIAIFAPLATYLGLRRKMSGQVTTSDADVLWKESGEIRSMLSQRIATLETRLDALGERIETLLTEAITLRAEKEYLTRENATLKRLLNGGNEDAPKNP